MGEYTGRRRGRPAPESAPGSEPGSEPAPQYEDSGYAQDYSYPAAEHSHPHPEHAEQNYFADDGYYSDPGYDTGPGYDSGSDHPEPEPQPQPGYAYAEPRFETPRRRSRGDAGDLGDPDTPQADRSGRGSSPTAAPNHLPLIAATAIALIAATFVSPVAIAAVTALLQAAAAWAALDILGIPSWRSTAIALVPALAADAGAFRFSADVAATAVAAGIGCGFVLAAADTVLRARRHGVEPGASKELAATVTALLVACLAGLFVAAGRLDHVAVVGGGVVMALLAHAASRSRELSGSRAAVVGLPCTAAALAAYAAAILMA